MPLRTCPRRRLISLSPRYLLTWQWRRLSTVSTPHLWMLLCRRSHTVLFLRTFLRRWVLAKLPRFLLTRLSRLQYAVLYHTILPHNYRSRSSLLDVSSRTILLIVSARHRYEMILAVSHHLYFLTLSRLALSPIPVDLVRTLAPRALLQPPPGLEQYAPPPGLAIDAHLCTPHGILVKAAPPRPRLRSAISVTPPQPPVCTIHVGTHHARSATTGKRSAGTALAGTHNPVDTDPRAGTGPFPKPRALVLHLVHFGQSKPDGHGYIDTADSDLMHHQFRLSLLQWNPGLARRNPTNIVSAACGKFHAVILQEAGDHVPHMSEQFLVCTGNTDLAILLSKDTSEPDPIVLTFKVDSTSKGTWGMVLLIVRGLLRRPSLSGSPTVTFYSVHIHNVVAKKRDASSCQSVLTSGVCIHMSSTSLTMLRLAWDLETNLLISRCSFIFALLIFLDPAASCVVSKHKKEDLSADTTKNVCRDDVYDRAPVHQGLVSVSFPTLLRSLVSLLLVCCSLHLH